jgi:hypothetical protein
LTGVGRRLRFDGLAVLRPCGLADRVRILVFRVFRHLGAVALGYSLSEIWQQGRRRALRARNRAYQAARTSAPADRRTIVVLGCQRSGTSLMLEVFDEDPRCLSFPEFSVLSGPREGGIRLRPVAEVRAHLERLRAPITVLKPLVESQHAHRLLDGLPNARAVWMFRGFESVAVSNVTYFGADNSERDLQLLLTNDPPNWRNEVVADSVRAVVRKHYAPDMSPYDAAALFWWARNRLFFDLALDERSDVFLCEYEALVAAPAPVMRSIYDFCDIAPPARDVTRRIHSRARDRGESSAISSDVRAVCAELHARLVDCSRRSGTATVE